MDNSAYIPGMCNINSSEVAYRRKARNFGIIASIVILAALFILNAYWWIAPLVLFVPVFIAAVGYLQVRYKFCVSYGAAGKQNATEGNEVAAEVEETAKSLDKARARKMNIQALGMTILILLAASVALYFR